MALRHDILASGAAGLACASAVMAAPAATQYQAELSSVAHTLATRADVLGKGTVQATLAGRTLTIAGTYAGLPSNATRAQLKMGMMMATPGVAFADIAVSSGTTGSLAGTVTLNAAQLASLRAGGLSIVIDSVKAPDGNLWGWLARQPDND